MEAMVGNAHHIEVQLIADGQGQAWAAGVRDCSCQRRHQKVIEESSSVVLTREQEEEVKEASRRLALESGYRNAGTVEFLYEPAEKRFSFMEVNARLQVEHPVTEAVTGLDLVKLQLHVAAGGRLEGEPPEPVGHAIEARLNAEDPAMGFSPTPGRVQVLDLASGPGVRVDRGIAAGDVIPPDFDSMVAKVIAYGRTRDGGRSPASAARCARRTVIIEDGTTNRAFLLAILDRPEFEAGEIDIAWLDRLGVSGEMEADAGADVALLQAAIELADRETATRARLLLRLRPPRPPRGRARRSRAPSRSATAARPTGSSSPSSRPGRYRAEVDGARRRGRGRAPERPRAPDHDRRRHAPHDDLPPGRRPAGRGPRRPAPHHPRRRRLRALARARRWSSRSRSPRATRWPRATSSRSSSR